MSTERHQVAKFEPLHLSPNVPRRHGVSLNRIKFKISSSPGKYFIQGVQPFK